MGAIDRLFKRWGYARLDRFGLVLTSEGRVLSKRPAVLDDGVGGRIVGWLDSDLAAMELDRWVAKPAAKPVSLPPVAPVRIAHAAPIAAQLAPPARPVIAPPPVVAVEPAVEEDDWEWEIAMARARAAAEWAEEAATEVAEVAPAPPARPASIERKREPMSIATAPIATAPVMAIAQPVGRTVIPVPQLPRAVDPRTIRPIARPASSPPRRFARSSQPVEDTARTFAAPANDDRTSPGTAMPPAASITRRVAAKQR